MSGAATEGEFSDQLVTERNWRLKEISDLASIVRKSDATLQRVLLRSMVTICYAHWEGYVRVCGKRYMGYVARRRFQYAELDRQFYRNYFLPRLAALSNSKTSISERCSLLDDILDAKEKRYSRVNDDLINTKANLNYEVLKDLCLICGVPFSIFDDDGDFIDKTLLKRRNAIAHGEDTLVGIEELETISQGTISLMRKFGDALENRVILRTFKVAS